MTRLLASLRLRFSARALLPLLLLLVPLGTPAPAAAGSAPIDELVVLWRTEAEATDAASLTFADWAALETVIRGTFTTAGQTPDGALRLRLDTPLSVDDARAVLNRLRGLPAVVYASLVAPAADPAGEVTRQPRSAAELPPVRRMIVKFRNTDGPGTSPQFTGPSTTDRLSLLAGQPLSTDRLLGNGATLLQLFFAVPHANAQTLARQFAQDPGVEYAEPDILHLSTAVPNDSSYGSEWHLMSAPTEPGGVNMPAAWNVTTGSASIVAAVIDTGALYNHPDLAGRFVGGYDMINDALVANDGDARDADPSDPGDWLSQADINANPSYWSYCSVRNSSWHGSHVAGTIAAATNNASGIAGINWTSKILPVRVLGRCGGYTSDIADAIRWAAGLSVPGVPANPNPARVLNLSLGGYACDAYGANCQCGSTTQSAVTAAVAAGAVVVVSAGNSNRPALESSPANCAGVITVGATGRSGQRASYSNYGPYVEISAPGGSDGAGVYSTINSSTTSVNPSGYTYALYQGTSMAAPHVTGIASLMLSVNPALTPAQVLAKIQSTARAFPTGTVRDCTTANCGAGIIDAGAAVTSAALPAITGDFDYDGYGEILWQNLTARAAALWFMQPSGVRGAAFWGVPTGWTMRRVGDFDGDGFADVLWTNSGAGLVAIWYMRGNVLVATLIVGVGPNWTPAVVGDLDGDKRSDIVWRSASGSVAVWLMKGTSTFTSVNLPGVGADWNLVGTGDFFGDGRAQLVWQPAATGSVVVWRNAHTTTPTPVTLGSPGTGWAVQGIGDFNADGRADLFWRNATGSNAVWLSGSSASAVAMPSVGTTWSIGTVARTSGDGRDNVVWTRSDGLTALWKFNESLAPTTTFLPSAPAGWAPVP